MMLVVASLNIAFSVPRRFPSTQILSRTFTMKVCCWILSKAFPASNEIIMWFVSISLLKCWVVLSDSHVLTISASLGWILPDLMVDNLFVIFSLICKYFSEFCIHIHQRYLYIYIWGRWVLSSFGVSNDGFILWNSLRSISSRSGRIMHEIHLGQGMVYLGDNYCFNLTEL